MFIDGLALKGGTLNFMNEQQDPLHTIKNEFDGGQNLINYSQAGI